MTPLERYQADLKRPEFFHDAAQETAVRHLQRLYDDLVAAEQNKPGLLGKLFGKKDQTPVKGLYFCCLLYTSPSPRDGLLSRMPSSA